jgi:HTH-type transcriptional regulator/antitoxin HigA
MVEPTAYRTPGQLLAELMTRRGWTQRTLAVVLGVGTTVVNKLIAGTRPVDAETALALGELFDVAPERFMELQMSFALELARLSVRPDPGRAARALLFGELPIAEMITRGWIKADDARDVSEVEKELTRFFGAKSLDQVEILPHAAMKTVVKTAAKGGASPAQLAWLHRVKALAREELVPRYSPGAGRDAVRRLSALLGAPEELRHAPRIVQQAGIRIVIVESLPGAKIDGVCFWLDDAAPVIGLSMRKDTMDNLCFVLRHEIEHILREHGRGDGRSITMLDAELEGEQAGVGDSVETDEREANDAAADFCVPRKSFEAFVSRKTPFFYERDIQGFARTLRIHPGLVAGQLQHHTGLYDRFRKLQVKVRSVVRQGGVTVDGWGDVAPLET